MDVIVQFPCAHATSGQRLASKQFLRAVVHDSGFDQLNEGIGENLSMKSEVLAIFKKVHQAS